MADKIRLMLVLITFDVISSDQIAMPHKYAKLASPQCTQHPPDKEYDCCPIPDLFDITTNQGCSPDDWKVWTISQRGSPECAERTCLLRNNDLLFDNDDIDKESVKQYLDEWVTRRREYMPAVTVVKERCLGKKPMFGPTEMCDADKLILCIHSNFYNKCPNWLGTDACTNLRAFLEACMPYFD